MVCSGCGKDTGSGGLELWGSWFCSTCFISNSAKLNKELTPEDLKLLRTIGRELAGLLPPEVLEMVLVGFFRRGAGRDPDPEELARCVGEVQRLSAFATFRKMLNLFQTWKDMTEEMIDAQEKEIRAAIRKLTGSDE